MLPYIATHIYTAFSNNITERFNTHLLRFVNQTISFEDKSVLLQFKRRIYLNYKMKIKTLLFKNGKIFIYNIYYLQL